MFFLSNYLMVGLRDCSDLDRLLPRPSNCALRSTLLLSDALILFGFVFLLVPLAWLGIWFWHVNQKDRRDLEDELRPGD